MGELMVLWEELAKAFCLMLVIEGVLPFLYPNRWRKMVESIAIVSDKQLRVLGFVSMILGVGLLYLLK